MARRARQLIMDAVGDLRWEPVPARLRARLGGRTVLDTRDALVVWEPRRLVPQYAVPPDGLAARLEPTDPQPAPPDLALLPPMMGPDDFASHTTPGTVVDLVLVDGDRLPAAGFVPDDDALGGAVVLDFTVFDEWRAEDEPLLGHPHDPFKRIDVLAADRLVEVSLGGTLLASSRRPLALLETMLPVRWYLPRADVRLDLLEPSPTRSTCAYKGVASYLSTADGSPEGRDVAWTYPDPLDDALRVRDHVCFWAERSDLTVDGVPVPRPITPWSSPDDVAAADPEDRLFG